MSKKLLVISLALAGGVVALVLSEPDCGDVQDLGVSDFVQRDVRDQRVRVHGTLIPGTLCRIEEPCGYRFALAETAPSPAPAPTLPVTFPGCTVPDPFLERPNQGHDVYVSGERCQGCHDFKATDILTRAYGKYEMYPTPSQPLPPLCDSLEPRM